MNPEVQERIEKLEKKIQELEEARSVKFAESIQKNVIKGEFLSAKELQSATDYRYSNAGGIVTANNTFNNILIIERDGKRYGIGVYEI